MTLANDIPYSRQDIGDEDIQAVADVLRADFLTQGPMVPKFEQAIAQHCGAHHAVAVNSATSALHIACLALDVGPGDAVWTSPTTFVASANCALYCGASVDFVDIDPRTYNMSVERLAAKLEAAQRTGTLPKVVIPVHFGGLSCAMREISELSHKYGFRVIEDASHAVGGRYRDEPIGCGEFSDITIFSFHPVKIITSGEGGMALTNDPQLARRMQLLRSHGITSDLVEMDPRPADEIWNYQQVDLGFNYRMTDLQAALGLSQFGRVDDFVRGRNEVASRYDEVLGDLPVTAQARSNDAYSSFHLYVIRLVLDRVKVTQREAFKAMHAAGIRVNLHYIPVYLQPYFQKLGFRPGYCPEAEAYFKSALSIPVYPSLTKAQQDRVVDTLKRTLLP